MVGQRLYTDLILVGDFNLRNIDWEDPACPMINEVASCAVEQCFIELFRDCFLTQHVYVYFPTFYKRKNEPI
jgi:hypothetical protein